MRIIQKYELAAKEKKSINIGVGLGDSEYHNQKILNASIKFSKKFNSTVSLFGKKDLLKILFDRSQNNMVNSQVKLIECQIPEKSIIEFLIKNSIHAIVRGSLSSTNFLKNLKKSFNMKAISIKNRLKYLK